MPRTKKIAPEPPAEPPAEPLAEPPADLTVVSQPDLAPTDSIMRVKKPAKVRAPKEPKEPKPKKEKMVKIVETSMQPVEDLDSKILRLVNQHLSSFKPPAPEPDEILVVKKRIKKAPPKKKTIWIEDDDTIENVVHHAHPSAPLQIQYW
jgi:hypothetical protein